MITSIILPVMKVFALQSEIVGRGTFASLQAKEKKVQINFCTKCKCTFTW